jgi:hypothetical protein
MRIFVRDSSGHRIYLETQVQCRSQLPQTFKIQCPTCGNIQVYNPNQIEAEPGMNATVGGTILGGLIGLLGGPFGLIVGGTVGGFLGIRFDEDERRRVIRFLRC